MEHHHAINVKTHYKSMAIFKFANCWHNHRVISLEFKNTKIRSCPFRHRATPKAIIHVIWVNYNELTASSLEIIVSKGKYPQMALIQVSEI